MDQTEKSKENAAYAKVIARAWRDPAFKAKLIADPEGTLREAGAPVPPGVKMTVVENTSKHFHLVLPLKPTAELSDEALDMVAGGSTGGGTAVYQGGPEGPYTSPWGGNKPPEEV